MPSPSSLLALLTFVLAASSAAAASPRFFALDKSLRESLADSLTTKTEFALPPSSLALIATDSDALTEEPRALRKHEVVLPSLASVASEASLVHLLVRSTRASKALLSNPLLSLKDQGLITYAPVAPGYHLVAFRQEDQDTVDAALYAFDKEIVDTSSPAPSFVGQTASTQNFRFSTAVDKSVLVKAVSSSVFEDFLAILTGEKLGGSLSALIKTRYTLVTDHLQAIEFTAGQLSALNYFDQIVTQDHTVSSSKTQNLIAVKKGSKTPNEIVVIGAHIDSTSENPKVLAPGAVDNGSGSAGVFAVAEAFSRYQYAPEKTIHFVFFTGEEQGLYGSKYYVKNNIAGSSATVSAALTMDMISYSNKYRGVTIEGTTNANIQKLMKLYAQNLDTYSPELTYQYSNNSFGSDHVSFQNAGVPAILAIEQDDTNYSYYHKTKDTTAYCNTVQSIGILKAMAGALYDLTA